MSSEPSFFDSAIAGTALALNPMAYLASKAPEIIVNTIKAPGRIVDNVKNYTKEYGNHPGQIAKAVVDGLKPIDSDGIFSAVPNTLKKAFNPVSNFLEDKFGKQAMQTVRDVATFANPMVAFL